MIINSLLQKIEPKVLSALNYTENHLSSSRFALWLYRYPTEHSDIHRLLMLKARAGVAVYLIISPDDWCEQSQHFWAELYAWGVEIFLQHQPSSYLPYIVSDALYVASATNSHYPYRSEEQYTKHFLKQLRQATPLYFDHVPDVGKLTDLVFTLHHN